MNATGKFVDDGMIRRLAKGAAASQRLRLNLNLHPTLEDPVQRFLNAVEPGSYIRPHQHSDPSRWELFLALAGAACVLTFDSCGNVLGRQEIRARGPGRIVEVPAGTWHTVSALNPGTVLFELKPGPYRPVSDKDVALWAPTEGEVACDRFAAWFATAWPGDTPPRL